MKDNINLLPCKPETIGVIWRDLHETNPFNLTLPYSIAKEREIIGKWMSTSGAEMLNARDWLAKPASLLDTE